jgi:hypothetical protein
MVPSNIVTACCPQLTSTYDKQALFRSPAHARVIQSRAPRTPCPPELPYSAHRKARGKASNRVMDPVVSSTSTAFCPGVMLFATVARAKMSLRHMLYRCRSRTCPRVLSRRCQSNSRPSSRRGGVYADLGRVPDGCWWSCQNLTHTSPGEKVE